MVIIILPVKGRQKNLLWCMGILLCPNHLQLTDKIWKKKKKKRKTKMEWNTRKSILAVSLSIGESLSFQWGLFQTIWLKWSTCTIMLIIQIHLAHELWLCSLVASFWLSILNLFFFHSFIEKFLFKPESRLCHDQVFYNKLLHNLTNGGHDLKQTMTSAGWRIVGYWPCKLSIWASGGYGRDIKNKDFKL